MNNTKSKITFSDIHKMYCDFIDLCGKHCAYTISINLQKQKIDECSKYIENFKGYKYQAQKRKNEEESNELFHMQCMLNTMKSSLLLWVKLKEELYHEAWCHLIDAQEYIVVARKIREYDGLEVFYKKLVAYEDLFPSKKIYNSLAFTETVGICSVCHKPFYECEHIENNIYMGILCQRVDRQILEAKHLALVENPRDRRCIINKMSNKDGVIIDQFTLEETDEKIEPSDNNLHAKSTIFHFPGLDFS
ncbi:MAG: hypothetical protein QS721_06635 [Candidatus Endonucleobacter sp. (ex Gigantidas childressi)]|nr:hypothetical protein [Candidatus Endonucleobacter sp. (ex Gigantidas childressi)]